LVTTTGGIRVEVASGGACKLTQVAAPTTTQKRVAHNLDMRATLWPRSQNRSRSARVNTS
jgi:hypothetical protein